ncbi:CBS domain-containing ParB/RepB/Spo0J family partition protein [Methanothermococcus okinawensis]|uniref:CBS domain containing protein n=1 Tax=Methanothermococcus okinawensis (strain DSM 14208 / JCM 11175 / IH1) TaxID=647113 RepID=F8ALK5_METOI|nr:CBS domain-containing protein [Methanothermococcus okinawensis]AEH07223.1 CBS domain containing protein [Methanothermococcus okinawensis IH1]
MVKVEEYMTKNVDYVNPEDKVKDVIELIKKTSHDTFPVVLNGKLIGIVSVHDLIGKDENEKIKNLMTKRENMIVTKPDANVRDVGRIMFRTGFSKLPVVDDDNNILGIITNTDVIRSQIEKTTPKKLNKIIETYKNLGYDLKLKKGVVPVEKIKPTQSKVYEDELFGRLYELKRGLAEPIIVIKTKKGDNYILIDGHHRAVACYLSKIPELDAYIIEINTDKPLGIEKTAEKQGLKTLSDIDIIDEDKNNSCEMYELGSKIAHLH